VFDVDVFISKCKAAVEYGNGQKEINSLVKNIMSEPSNIIKTFGEPTKAEVQKLYVSKTLTILHIVWGPQMMIMPHDHQMWAIIGIYAGREDNIFWRRIRGNEKGKLKAIGAQSLEARDVVSLGPDVVHSVTNPLERHTGAIHIYGGDFFNEPRSEWDPESYEEGQYNVENTLKKFNTSNCDL